uniref:(northern house mosquito) hypothetical protein n=1 Tax=Culex pipiens TaxID=7175 RepID=A0A8D8FBY2_CULPI
MLWSVTCWSLRRPSELRSRSTRTSGWTSPSAGTASSWSFLRRTSARRTTVRWTRCPGLTASQPGSCTSTTRTVPPTSPGSVCSDTPRRWPRTRRTKSRLSSTTCR